MAYCGYDETHDTTAIPDYQACLSLIIKEGEKARRQKKKIDRIAQKAEAAQRLAKPGSWK